MLFFNVGPDPYYHTNQDTQDKCDPTTLRRSAFIGITSALFIGHASGAEAISLAREMYLKALQRIDKDLEKGFSYFHKGDNEDLFSTYKEAKNVVRYAFVREKKALFRRN